MADKEFLSQIGSAQTPSLPSEYYGNAARDMFTPFSSYWMANAEMAGMFTPGQSLFTPTTPGALPSMVGHGAVAIADYDRFKRNAKEAFDNFQKVSSIIDRGDKEYGYNIPVIGNSWGAIISIGVGIGDPANWLTGGIGGLATKSAAAGLKNMGAATLAKAMSSNLGRAVGVNVVQGAIQSGISTARKEVEGIPYTLEDTAREFLIGASIGTLTDAGINRYKARKAALLADDFNKVKKDMEAGNVPETDVSDAITTARQSGKTVVNGKVINSPFPYREMPENLDRPVFIATDSPVLSKEMAVDGHVPTGMDLGDIGTVMTDDPYVAQGHAGEEGHVFEATADGAKLVNADTEAKGDPRGLLKDIGKEEKTGVTWKQLLQGASPEEAQMIKALLQEQGYDGLSFKNGDSNTVVLFDNTKLKVGDPIKTEASMLPKLSQQDLIDDVISTTDHKKRPSFGKEASELGEKVTKEAPILEDAGEAEMKSFHEQKLKERMDMLSEKEALGLIDKKTAKFKEEMSKSSKEISTKEKAIKAYFTCLLGGG